MFTRLLTACAVSAAIVLASPFMGQLQSTLRASVSTRAYVLVLGGVVAGAILAAIAGAFIRIKGHRTQRIALMAAALLLGAAYIAVMSTGDPTIDAVERVHFVEYGLIAVLFYRAWRTAGDVSAIVLPLLCGFIVGTLDEWLQWFIPYRVGEMHDVFLNLTALGCGVLFGMALEPPRPPVLALTAASMRRAGVALAATVLVFAGFVSSVHLGYLLEVEGVGSFQSQHTLHELNALQADRAERWKTAPPVGIRRLSREDQYLDEGLWHVRERNRRWDAGDVRAAWHENLLLERFFAPVLDSKTYLSPNGTRWPPEHRLDAEKRVTPINSPFVSAAAPRTIYAWSKPVYWLAVSALCLLFLIPAARRSRGDTPQTPAPRPRSTVRSG
jgi:VanZ family protein